MGDYLIVGVISDENVLSYKRTPILSLENRVTILQHIDFVDEVVANCPFQPITKDFLEEKKIDVVVYASEDGQPHWNDHYQEAIKKILWSMWLMEKTIYQQVKLLKKSNIYTFEDLNPHKNTNMIL